EDFIEIIQQEWACFLTALLICDDRADRKRYRPPRVMSPRLRIRARAVAKWGSLSTTAVSLFFWSPATSAQTIVAWGNTSSGPTTVPPSATNVIAVGAGGS